MLYAQVRPKTGLGNSWVFNKSVSNNKLNHSKTVYGNLKTAQADGLYQSHYVDDHPINHSDPPYSTIKPAYRPHKPNCISSSSLDMKHQYSFKAFGNPKVERNS